MEKNRIIIFLAILLIGLVLNEPFLIILSSAILMIITAANWWKTKSLDGITYQRIFHFTRGFPGEKINLNIEIENKKLLPLSWIRVQDDWDRSIGPVNQEILAPSHIIDRGFLVNIFRLRWYEKASRSYKLLLRKRGIFTVGPARIDTGDLFGIFEKNKMIENPQYVTVFPTLYPFSNLKFTSDDPFGDLQTRRRLYEDPNRPIGVRGYRPDDSFRRIHWPATARTGQLQVKVYQPTSGQVMMVCMNVATFARYWEGIYPELLEHIIKTAATIVHEGLLEGYKVGLVANGSLAHADQPFRIPPGRSPQQLAMLLQSLAGVNSVITGDFGRFLLKEVPRVQYGSTLIVLTAITSPELASTLIQLRHHGRKIILYSVAEETPPIIPGIQIIHQPFTEINS
jgi:uncharacterized protein (DUF58 family)